MDSLIFKLAGVDASIIAETDAKWRRKYRRSGLGMLIIGLMSAVSGGYMFWVIFGSVVMAIPFCIFWAVIMQNLYRLVLVTVGNPHIPHSPKYRFPFGTFLFRSLFLIVLGLFIVKPVEVLLLSRLITPHLEVHKEEIIKKYQARIDAFESENVSAVFSSDDLIENRAVDGGYLMTRIQIMHRDFPAVWLLTAFLLWIFIWPFWSRVNMRRKSLYEQQRGDIETSLISEDYQAFKDRFTSHMLAITGRDDIWEEPYHDMPFKNEPIVYEQNDYMRSGSIYAWGRIFARETDPASDETEEDHE